MAHLQIVNGNLKGQKITIDRDEVIIGRSHDNIVCIDDPASSGKHCAIIRKGRIFSLRDLDSTNGTRLNDVHVTEYQLSPKDIITIGGTQLKFDGKDVESASATSLPDTKTQVTVKMNMNTVGTPAAKASFGIRQQKKGLWVAVIIVLSILAILAGLYFVLQYIKI